MQNFGEHFYYDEEDYYDNYDQDLIKGLGMEEKEEEEEVNPIVTRIVNNFTEAVVGNASAGAAEDGGGTWSTVKSGK